MNASTPPGQAVVDTSQTSTFDLEAHHALEARDTQLIIDQLTFGALSTDWVFSVPAAGGAVKGISVVGTRHLKAVFGGIKHRILFSIEKKGPVWMSLTYPQPGIPAQPAVHVFPETAQDPDFYKVLVEVEDVKTGSTIQDEKMELRTNYTKDGKSYENAHFATIAQSKAFRNAVEHILPQDFVEKFVRDALELKQQAGGRSDSHAFTESKLDEARKLVARYATTNGFAINRVGLNKLDMAQVAGIRDAAQTNREAFHAALTALNLTNDPIAGQVRRPPTEAKGPAKANPASEQERGSTGTATNEGGADKQESQTDSTKTDAAKTSPAQIEHDKTLPIDIGLNDREPDKAQIAGETVADGQAQTAPKQERKSGKKAEPKATEKPADPETTDGDPRPIPPTDAGLFDAGGFGDPE